MALRRDYPPELRKSAVHAALRALQVSEAIPPNIYVADYADGVIPDWRIHSREDTEAGVVILVAFDLSNSYVAGSEPATRDGLAQFSLFGDGHMCYPAVRILSSQAKTLRCHPIEFNDSWPNTLCDMIQQATHIGGKRQKASDGDGG